MKVSKVLKMKDGNQAEFKLILTHKAIHLMINGQFAITFTDDGEASLIGCLGNVVPFKQAKHEELAFKDWRIK